MSGTVASMAVGRHLPGYSVLHLRDPRVKLLGCLGFSVSLFFVSGWRGLAVLVCGLILGLVLSHPPLGSLWRGFRPLALLLVVTFLLQLLSYPGTRLAGVGPFVITSEGLDRGAFITLRLASLLVAGSLLTLTTSPVSLADGLEWLLRPLRRLRVPTSDIALMLTIALRFIPTLMDELDDLVRAQRARGIPLGSRDPRLVVHNVLPLLVPLFVLSFRRADDLAVAMVSRCYRGGAGRTRFRELKFRVGDALAGLAGVAWLAAGLTAGRLW